MTDWLPDDLLVSLVAASAVAVALSSCLRRRRRTTVAHQRTDDPPPVPAAEQHDRKSTRSKERRRRGKDPLRDLFKGGKKSKALLKAITADHISPSADTLSISSAPPNDTPSSTSRSQSPEPAGDMRLDAEMVDGGARSTTPNGNSSSTSAGDVSDHSSSDTSSQADDVRTHSGPMTAMDTEANATSASTIIAHASEENLSSPLVLAACEDTPTTQPRNSHGAASTSGSCAKLVRARTRLRLSRMDPGVKSSLLPPPLADSVTSHSNSIHSDVSCPSLSIIPSTHSTDGAGPPTPTNSRGSTPPPRSLSPSEQREPSAQPLNENAAGAQAQLASMRSALEAAHLREEQLRVEAERASKECDELRWRWNEDAGVWRRREAELQAQIHHLMQQLQAYAAVASFQAQQASSAFSSPTSPHAHSSPRLQHHPLVSFPLPPAIQTQNSASAPAHVQALLASAPMLTSHSPGFAAPSGGLYSSTSPLWPGQGLCVPNWDARHGGRRTPDSSASGSSSRGRRRRRRTENAKRASDESSLGDWDDMEDGSGDEEEDIFRNNALADAILKRPESIRGLSSSVGKGRMPSGGRPLMGGVGERMDTLKDPALENAH